MEQGRTPERHRSAPRRRQPSGQTAPIGSGRAPERTTPDRAGESERGLRALVGSGPSQLSPSAAMRARDACQPTAADLAAADQELTIVQRGWRPDTDLPGYRA